MKTISFALHGHQPEYLDFFKWAHLQKLVGIRNITWHILNPQKMSWTKKISESIQRQVKVSCTVYTHQFLWMVSGSFKNISDKIWLHFSPILACSCIIVCLVHLHNRTNINLNSFNKQFLAIKSFSLFWRIVFVLVLKRMPLILPKTCFFSSKLIHKVRWITFRNPSVQNLP